MPPDLPALQSGSESEYEEEAQYVHPQGMSCLCTHPSHCHVFRKLQHKWDVDIDKSGGPTHDHGQPLHAVIQHRHTQPCNDVSHGPARARAPNSHALDALVDRPLLDEALDAYTNLDNEVLLELELKLELELFSAIATTTSVGVWTAGLGKGVSLLVASCPRRSNPKHFTAAARSSSPIP